MADNAYTNDVINVMRTFKGREEAWVEDHGRWQDLYNSNPAAFDAIWEAHAEEEQLTVHDLDTFKKQMARYQPAYNMYTTHRDLCPHTKEQLYQQVVPTLDDNSQLKARAAQAIQSITDHRTPNKRNREGWYNLASTELLAAIDDGLSAGDITPAAVGGEAPTYDPKAADIKYAVFIEGYMVHLAKEFKT